MSAFEHVEVYADAAGEWRWRLVAANGRIVAASAEAFASKSNAKRAADHLAAQIGETDMVTVVDAERETR